MVWTVIMGRLRAEHALNRLFLFLIIKCLFLPFGREVLRPS